MFGFCLVLAIVMFIAGLGVGFLTLVVVGIHAEGRRYPMRASAPGVITRGARAVNGLHVISRPSYEAARYRHRQPPPGPGW
jgi:hypothetical protein